MIASSSILPSDFARAAPGIAVRNARLVYEGAPLFDGLDFVLEAGRCTCLLGPSGIGKSSLLRLIAGLAEGATGAVEASDHRPLNDRVALMAQQDLLLPWLTAFENTLLGFRLREQTPPRETAIELLKHLGLIHAMHLRPAALSGGMRQRVALARTLMEDRPVVLMDEPFSGLDAITRLRLQTLAANELRGRTVLLVTHDPLEALRLGHRIVVMTGRPARLSDPLELASPTPRDPTDPDLLRRQAELLDRLAAEPA
ncbi:MAG TPA: ABC transporter ATP-binding protein [Magnetospirillaceae bacterium]